MQLRFTLPLLFILLCTCVRAQTDLTVGSEVTIGNRNRYWEYIIPDTLDNGVLDFFLRGSDGGTAKVGGCKEPGGEGAEVSGTFPIGDGNNALKPGATVRFIVAKPGIEVNAGGGLATGAASWGGSGTALLYTEGDPTAIDKYALTEDLALATTHWVMLGVAGGGGGAHQGKLFGCIDNRRGDNGSASTSGTDGNPNGDDDAGAGGSNGNGGAGGESINAGGSGGGAYSDGGGDEGDQGPRGSAEGERKYHDDDSSTNVFSYGFGTGGVSVAAIPVGVAVLGSGAAVAVVASLIPQPSIR